jgi:protein-disulfide isomerase
VARVDAESGLILTNVVSVVTARRWAGRGGLISVAVAGILAGCGRRSPSPDELREMLIAHPDILYSAIRAHPAEFMLVVQGAARTAQGQNAAITARDDSMRIESELLHPKHPVIERRAVLGNPAAPITIVEYTDFQCPYCRQERDVLADVIRRYGDSVRLLVKQMPVTQLHPHAMDAALMFEAVARQDPMKAYRLYDDLYANQEQLGREGQRYLEAAVGRLGVDSAKALEDQRSAEVRAIVDADLKEGERFGFTGTPGFLVNGVSLQGAYPLEAFVRLIDRQLAARAVSTRAH